MFSNFSQLWTDFNLLILNLMVTELIVSAYGIPIAAVASAQKGWKMGAIFCKASGFILTLLGELNLVWVCRLKQSSFSDSLISN